MNIKISSVFVLLVSFLLFSCNNTAKKPANEVAGPKLVQKDLNYQLDTMMMDGYVVYDENIEGKRPAVIVVPEWWGLNDYAKRRANELAELGYIAMAIDVYGDGKRGADPASAGALATPFYKDPTLAKTRFDAALAQLSSYPQADMDNLAAIGYCFGGSVVLNVARLGEDLKGVVSFHGNLLGAPADKELLKAKVLVLHGEEDKFVPQENVDAFKQQMDSIGATYTFKSYPGATHAFTNPAATANGEKFNIPIAYNAAADTASWKEMEVFFADLFE